MEAVLRGTPERWMSNLWVAQYQALLLVHCGIQFHKPSALKPAVLLPTNDPEELLHD